LSCSAHFIDYPHHTALPPVPTRRSSDLQLRAPLLGLRAGGMQSVCAVRRLDAQVFVRQIEIAACLLVGRGARFGSSKVVGLQARSEEHTSELQSRENLVCRLLLEKKKCK